MTKKKWIETIKRATQEIGTYKSAFDDSIDALADVLIQRDAAMKQFKAEGSELVVTHINKAGAENNCKNPLFSTWQDLTALALTYWRDLGLTPMGLKRISENAMKAPKQSALGEALDFLKNLDG